MDQEKDDIRNRIIGLGKYSFKKSFFPELQKNLNELNIFKEVFDQTLDMILLFDPEKGQVFYMNQAAEIYFNYRMKPGLLLSEIIDPEYWNTLSLVISEKNQMDRKTFRYKFIGKKQTVFLENSLSLIKRSNHQLGSVIIRDVTESVIANELLMQEKERALELHKKKEGLLNAIPDLMFMFNREGIIIDYHTTNENDFFITPKLFLNKNIHDILPAPIAEQTTEYLKKVFETKQTQNYTYTILRQKKKEVFEARLTYVDKNIALSIVRNITERVEMVEELKKAKEKAEESDSLKSSFLANMSHEIRTPMNGIIGFAGLLDDDAIERETRANYIEIINQSCEDLLRIINDILDISKLEAKQLTIAPTNFRLNLMLEQIIQFFEIKIENQQKQIEISWKSCFEPPNDLIFGDHFRIKQILNNLLENAVKFTPKGTIALNCEFTGSYLKFSVTDTGIGIQKEKQQLIFDRFRQSDELINARFGGTGLGLSISKGLVQLMGGEIGVESEPGSGSFFWFTLPYAQN